jgi:putative serine/threonine protein kinase
MRMIEQEVQLLRMANQVGVGPKIEEVDVDEGIIVMSLIHGITLDKWIDSVESRVKVERALSRLFAQARKLDRAGIDHGQLGGKLRNILIDDADQPTILDFEKASYVRATHNVGRLKGVLLQGHTEFSKKILRVWPEAVDELHL